MVDEVLIPRHLRLLAYIRDFEARHRYAPSFRQMMSAVRMHSTNSVAEVLQKFIARGLIVRAEGVARSVSVTEKGKRLLRSVGRPTKERPALRAS